MNRHTISLIFACTLLACLTPYAAEGGEGGPITDPIPEPILPFDQKISLEPVADGLTAPNWGTFAPGLRRHLFVTDQSGILWQIDLKTGSKHAFLDVTDRIVELGIAGPGTFDERGLLGVAFHPRYRANGLFYTYTSEPADQPADFPLPGGVEVDHQSVITEWYVRNPRRWDNVVDPATARVLFRVDQPQFNHDGGAINFGPDRMLYIAFGDGGGADDQGDGHSAGGNGQDTTNVLGTVLRIDPAGSNSTNGQYGVPADNPYVGNAAFIDEIFAYGLRNPFRFSFDRLTGRLVLADVGQNDIEEVNVVQSGDNLGWPWKEGTFFFDPNGEDAGFVTDVDPGAPAGLVDPIAQYDHDEGLAIIGGFVYRGRRIRPLRGHYIFGDYARTFSNDGRLFGTTGRNPRPGISTGISEFEIEGGPALGLSLLGFGQDARGEIYVLGNSTGIPFGDTGVVYRIAPGSLTMASTGISSR